LHEDDGVVFRNRQQVTEGGFSGRDNVAREGGAMRVLGYPKAGVLEIEDGGGGVLEDGGREAGRAGAEVGYLFTSGHFGRIEYMIFLESKDFGGKLRKVYWCSEWRRGGEGRCRRNWVWNWLGF